MDSVRSVWVASSRPLLPQDDGAKEWLLQLNVTTGEEVHRFELPSQDTQDAVRFGSSVWVCDTGQRQLLQFSYPSMKLKRKLSLFGADEHISNIAVFDRESVWLVLHKFGNSSAVRVNVKAGAIDKRLENIGSKVHSIVSWKSLFVMLDSDRGDLFTLSPSSERRTIVWQGGAGAFLKGLVVVDDVAYFGVATVASRAARASSRNPSELAAVSLLDGTLVFKRTLNTSGLINTVAVPELAVASTCTAVVTPEGRSRRGGATHVKPGIPAGDHVGGGGGSVDPAVLEALQRRWAQEGGLLPTKVDLKLLAAMNPKEPLPQGGPLQLLGGQWSTGLDRLNLALKGRVPDDIPEDLALAKVQLRLGRVENEKLRKLQEYIRSIPVEWWDPSNPATKRTQALIAGRADSLLTVKPGVSIIQLVFSTHDARRIWQLPLYDSFKDVVEPVLWDVIGRQAMGRIIRLQVARMKWGAVIKLHKDSGRWAEISHRIHIVVISNFNVTFVACGKCAPYVPGGLMREQDYTSYRRHSPDCVPHHGHTTCTTLDAHEGDVFEMDNLVRHSVENNGQYPRVHLVVDVSEDVFGPRVMLRPGQICHYDPGKASLDEGC